MTNLAAPPCPKTHRQIQKVQRDRETDYGDIERLIDRETDETDDTDGSALAASVKTLPDAVRLSLVDGLTEDCLFRFARAVKAFEVTTRTQLPPGELSGVFSLWWATAKPLLDEAEDFDTWRFDFISSYQKAKTPMGSNALTIAKGRAGQEPPECERYTSQRLRRLVSVCFHLQAIAGDGPFFISVRDAAKILEMPGLHSASAQLNGLVFDGILRVERKGSGKKATRFRYLKGSG